MTYRQAMHSPNSVTFSAEEELAEELRERERDYWYEEADPELEEVGLTEPPTVQEPST